VWAPRRAAWWIGVLFSIGSLCFVVGPLPGFVQLVGSAPDGTVFFVGSIFFTSAALLQYIGAANYDRRPGRRIRLLTWEPRRSDWWATLIQLAGTVFFNLSTYHALADSLETSAVNRLVWAPDVFGSICFLIAGAISYAEARSGGILATRHSAAGRIATVNLIGCILFGISAIASFIVPATGDELDLAAANVTTSLGALCFLIGALRLLRDPSG
jgi:hypothetical protein